MKPSDRGTESRISTESERIVSIRQLQPTLREQQLVGETNFRQIIPNFKTTTVQQDLYNLQPGQRLAQPVPNTGNPSGVRPIRQFPVRPVIVQGSPRHNEHPDLPVFTDTIVPTTNTIYRPMQRFPQHPLGIVHSICGAANVPVSTSQNVNLMSGQSDFLTMIAPKRKKSRVREQDTSQPFEQQAAVGTSAGSSDVINYEGRRRFESHSIQGKTESENLSQLLPNLDFPPAQSLLSAPPFSPRITNSFQQQAATRFAVRNSNAIKNEGENRFASHLILGRLQSGSALRLPSDSNVSSTGRSISNISETPRHVDCDSTTETRYGGSSIPFGFLPSDSVSPNSSTPIAYYLDTTADLSQPEYRWANDYRSLLQLALSPTLDSASLAQATTYLARMLEIIVEKIGEGRPFHKNLLQSLRFVARKLAVCAQEFLAAQNR